MPVGDPKQPRAVVVRFYTVLSPEKRNNATLIKTVKSVPYNDRTTNTERKLYTDRYCNTYVQYHIKYMSIQTWEHSQDAKLGARSGSPQSSPRVNKNVF